MSAWRITIRKLYAMPGHSATHRELDFAGGLPMLQRLKLITREHVPGCHRHGSRIRFTLTPLGIDFCEGRAMAIVGPAAPGRIRQRGPLQMAATWLSALPQGVRITPYPWASPCSAA